MKAICIAVLLGFFALAVGAPSAQAACACVCIEGEKRSVCSDMSEAGLKLLIKDALELSELSEKDPLMGPAEPELICEAPHPDLDREVKSRRLLRDPMRGEGGGGVGSGAEGGVEASGVMQRMIEGVKARARTARGAQLNLMPSSMTALAPAASPSSSSWNLAASTTGDSSRT